MRLRPITHYRMGGSLSGIVGVITVGEVPANRRGGSFGGWCYRRDGRFTGGETNLYNVTVLKNGFPILVYIRKNDS